MSTAYPQETLQTRVERQLRENQAALREAEERAAQRDEAARRLFESIQRSLGKLRRAGVVK